MVSKLLIILFTKCYQMSKISFTYMLVSVCHVLASVCN